MTIRQALRRWFSFLWVGLMVVGILAGSWRPHTWHIYYLRMAVLAFLAISVIGVFAFGFVCPRCRRSLLMNSSTIFGARPSACPKCGVSLDEPEKTHDTPT
jgi:hypothetical protein